MSIPPAAPKWLSCEDATPTQQYVFARPCTPQAFVIDSTTRNYLDRLIWYSPASPFAPAMPT